MWFHSKRLSLYSRVIKMWFHSKCRCINTSNNTYHNQMLLLYSQVPKMSLQG